MSGDFITLPGFIVGGGELIVFDEIKKRVKHLGKIVSTTNGFRLIPYSGKDDVLDFDQMYPVVYFNKDYTVDLYITGMKYENVNEFMGKLADALNVPIKYADANGKMDGNEDELRKLEKFYENLGGYYGRGKK